MTHLFTGVTNRDILKFAFSDADDLVITKTMVDLEKLIVAQLPKKFRSFM
jgi:hypothetical protein